MYEALSYLCRRPKATRVCGTGQVVLLDATFGAEGQDGSWIKARLTAFATLPQAATVSSPLTDVSY